MNQYADIVFCKILVMAEKKSHNKNKIIKRGNNENKMDS